MHYYGFFTSRTERERSPFTLDNEKRLFTLDLPGVDPSMVSVEVDVNTDRITINVGEKQYSIVFASFDPDAVTASLKHGRLTIVAPKPTKEVKKTVKIEIG